MGDIHIRRRGRSGRITLTRPKALNALSYEMCLEIEAALDAWADDPEVQLVVIDAVGEKAFCAGGDIAEMYATGKAGDFAYGRRFWADEYRLNAKIARYGKPYVAFCQGFTMGGGVGVACHGSHRVVGDSSKISMPECGIGLVPDVGGTHLLAQAPGRLGEYLGTTGARMGPGDAILAGFADHYIPEALWPEVIAALEETGAVEVITARAEPAPEAPLAAHQAEIDTTFGAGGINEVLAALASAGTDFAAGAEKTLRRASPISVACTLELVARARTAGDVARALEQEYRFTWRSAQQADFIEGIRAAIIDKDRSPNWQHARAEDVTAEEIAAMLAPLGKDELAL
ncbi:MAG: enoyl-CoA hydratase/isomerase family protein [Rhodobacteraceae bacterium]|nr:enoyl-CoA hydratase/isomerase family protein [Paracoccaceae bacterium]